MGVDVSEAAKLYESGLSLSEVSRVLGCSATLVRNGLVKAGHRLRTPSEGNLLSFREGRRQVANNRLVGAEIADQMAQEYRSGKSIAEISERSGVAKSTVRNTLLYLGVSLRRASEAVKNAIASGRKSPHPSAGKHVRTPEIREKQRRAMLARGGKGLSLKPNGYLEITRGEHKARGQHRVIMEQILGRALAANEVVHHKDHDRANNDPANLEVMTRAEHARHHIEERIRAGEQVGRHLNRRTNGS